MIITTKQFDNFRHIKKETVEGIKSAGTQLIKNLAHDDREIAGWAKMGGGYYSVTNAREKLVPGFYVATLTLAGPCFIPFNVSNDQILDLPDAKTENIVGRGNEFWALKDTFAALQFLHKRGILLDGQVGTGKSVIAFKLGKNLIEQHAGVVLYPTDPYSLSACAADFRSIEPDTKILNVMEDIDEWCAYYGEKKITAFLDGEHQVNNILNIATTNNIKGLSPRLTARPSRFDVKETITPMSKEARISFLTQKATTLTEEQINTWAEKTDGFTVPALKELMILVLAYTYPLDESIAKINRNFIPKVQDM